MSTYREWQDVAQEFGEWPGKSRTSESFPMQIINMAEEISRLRRIIDKELTQNRLMREALEYYAQKTDLYGEKSSQYNCDYENYRILEDKGSRAREALKKCEDQEIPK